MATDWATVEVGAHWARKETFEDADLLLAATQKLLADAGCDVGVLTPGEAIEGARLIGFDATLAWFSQNTRRETLRVSEVGDQLVLNVPQFGGMLGRLWDQRRFIPGKMLWSRTPEELEAEAVIHGTPFLAVVLHLADVLDEVELEKRANLAVVEAAQAAIDGDERAKEVARNAAIRFRTAAMIRRGEIDTAPLCTPGVGVD